MLSVLELKRFRPQARDYQKADGGGLSLLVRAGGKMLWVYEYVASGKKERVILGEYPAIDAPAARAKHSTLRAEFKKSGLTPKQQLDAEEELKKPKPAPADTRPTFASIAERYRNEWIAKEWKHPDKRWAFINRHLIVEYGAQPFEAITKTQVRELLLLKRETSGEPTAVQLLRALRHIYKWAIGEDICTNNPAEAIPAKRIGKTIARDRKLSAPEIKRYLTLVYQSSNYRSYKLGLHLLLIFGVRLNELCGASWQEFSEDGKVWTIPKERMKGNREHCIILPTQAIEMLEELRYLSNGSVWVFPMPTDTARCMNGQNFGASHRAACALGGIVDYLIHDHRHTVSTYLNGLGKYPERAIEAVLAHKIRGIAGVYNNNDYKELRGEIMQYWADTLDGLMNESTVIRANFKRAA